MTLNNLMNCNLQMNGLMEAKILLDNIDKIHTTEMGIKRIKKNLKLDECDAVEYCKNKVLDKNCNICKQGKNWKSGGRNLYFLVFFSFQIIFAYILIFLKQNANIL